MYRERWHWRNYTIAYPGHRHLKERPHPSAHNSFSQSFRKRGATHNCSHYLEYCWKFVSWCGEGWFGIRDVGCGREWLNKNELKIQKFISFLHITPLNRYRWAKHTYLRVIPDLIRLKKFAAAACLGLVQMPKAATVPHHPPDGYKLYIWHWLNLQQDSWSSSADSSGVARSIPSLRRSWLFSLCTLKGGFALFLFIQKCATMRNSCSLCEDQRKRLRTAG